MAKITDNRYECDYCEKPFKTAQGVRAHVRDCSTRRLRQQASTQVEAEPPPSIFADRESRRRGPDAQEMKLILLDTGEKVIQLGSDACHHAWWADFLLRTASSQVKGDTTPEEWARIAQDLGDIERDFNLMIGPLRLNRSLLFNSYHRMLAIQNAWLVYQARDFTCKGELTPKGEEVLREEQALFVELILNIKRMLVAAR